LRGFSSEISLPRIDQVLPIDEHRAASGLAVSRIILIRHGEVRARAISLLQEIHQRTPFYLYSLKAMLMKLPMSSMPTGVFLSPKRVANKQQQRAKN
jgi:hypothetical protein